MTKTKPASLAGVFAAKGAAKPADATKPIDTPVAPASTVMQPPMSVQQSKPDDLAAPAPRIVIESSQPAYIPVATKSLTVKVDVATYGKLKAHGGALGGKTNQDIFVEALGLYFSKYGIK